MEGIDGFDGLGGSQSVQSTITEMKGLTLLLSKWKYALIRFRNKYIPYLVYKHADIDVSIEIKITSQEQFETLAKVEAGLRDLGFSFDTGYGCGGRDWEWDWSLKGPAIIKFVGVRKKPRVLYGTSNQEIINTEKDLIDHAFFSNKERGN